MKKNFYLIAIWFIIAMAVLTLSLGMISRPNTIENIIGIVILGLFASVSVETKYLTSINLKKHEK